MNMDNHPCFNASVHKTFGRVHLPVAPRCNIQCKFCNRKFDCVNESRPGVTSGVLTPQQAMVYLEEVFKEKKNLSVVGIAGPGDPFANPEETMETLRLVREKYPEILLCVATNGLNIGPYLAELAELKVSHVTITVNAVDPAVGAQIYSWMRLKRRVVKAEQGAEILLKRQLEAIEGLKKRGLAVKVNSIIIPGLNEEHMGEIAKKAAELNVDILNCVPYYPARGSAFEDMDEPTSELLSAVRAKAGKFIRQMRHCTRCRADAAGMLGEAPGRELMDKLRACEGLDVSLPRPKVLSNRSHVAVASLEGVLVNQHLGQAEKLLIYCRDNGEVRFLEARKTPEPGGGGERWKQLSEILSDCQALLVNGVGDSPRRTLTGKGLELFEIEGLIDEAVKTVFEGGPMGHMIKRAKTACGQACSGRGGGCG